MKQRSLRFVASVLVLVLMFAVCPPALAVDRPALEQAVMESAAYMLKTVQSPQVGSIGGEWAVLGLARSGCPVPERYYQAYYAAVEDYVKACEGILHEKKYTEHARVILALTAIGRDPTNVGGYNLLTALGDFDATVRQGINGPIWALIALDSGSYAMPLNPNAVTQATRQMYVDEILSRRLSDGGWSLSGRGGDASPSDPDITGMALQALANYRHQEAVKAATDGALRCMSEKQQDDGGFSARGNGSAESAAQMLTALCELGISVDDSRFVKNGQTVLDHLLSFRLADGSFRHIAGGVSNQMSGEQGLYALAAVWRMENGKSSLYRMGDAVPADGGGLIRGAGLPGKHADVKALPAVGSDTVFDDMAFSENAAAVEALASRGIVNGMGGGIFGPGAQMTRAEFAAIMVKSLGLTAAGPGAFTDALSPAWYAAFVDTASRYGIVNGVGAGRFNPSGTITRQEAVVMVARAATLCGMEPDRTAADAKDLLARFEDCGAVADWAQDAFAFCYESGILDRSDLGLQPDRAVLRGEVAQMIFNLLTQANLI